MPDILQRPADPRIAPRRILFRHPHDESPDLCEHARTTAPPFHVRPLRAGLRSERNAAAHEIRAEEANRTPRRAFTQLIRTTDRLHIVDKIAAASVFCLPLLNKESSGGR